MIADLSILPPETSIFGVVVGAVILGACVVTFALLIAGAKR